MLASYAPLKVRKEWVCLQRGEENKEAHERKKPLTVYFTFLKTLFRLRKGDEHGEKCGVSLMGM